MDNLVEDIATSSVYGGMDVFVGCTITGFGLLDTKSALTAGKFVFTASLLGDGSNFNQSWVVRRACPHKCEDGLVQTYLAAILGVGNLYGRVQSVQELESIRDLTLAGFIPRDPATVGMIHGLVVTTDKGRSLIAYRSESRCSENNNFGGAVLALSSYRVSVVTNIPSGDLWSEYPHVKDKVSLAGERNFRKRALQVWGFRNFCP